MKKKIDMIIGKHDLKRRMKYSNPCIQEFRLKIRIK